MLAEALPIRANPPVRKKRYIRAQRLQRSLCKRFLFVKVLDFHSRIQSPFSAAAASALPPPMPAPCGMCLMQLNFAAPSVQPGLLHVAHARL